MGVTIHCDNIKAEAVYEQLGTDICSITAVKWETSCMASLVLLAMSIFIMQKWKYRCHKTLLTFHNLRAAVALILLAINTIELAKALLPLPNDIIGTVGVGNGQNGYENIYKGSGSVTNLPQQQQQQEEQKQQYNTADTEPDHIIVVIGFATLANALAAITLTIMLMSFHRIVELKKSLDFLYVSSTLSVLIFILRVFELAEIVYYDSIMALESVVQASSALCLLSLAFIDGFTVYKERYRPDYLEDYEKIGYKHTLATFYSKICFWWLTPVLWFGYKEPLELEDLGQMRVEDSARAHYDRFLLIYKTAKVKNANKPPSLWLCYLKSSWRMFTLGGLLKLFGDLFAVIGPLAIQQIVQYIESMYGMHYNNALLQMNSTRSNGQSKGNKNTSITTTPETQSSLSNILTSSFEANGIGRSIRSHINIREALVKAVQQAVGQATETAATATAAAAAATATGSIWMPTTNDSSHSLSSSSNMLLDNNINTNVYNQIANGIDYNIDTTPSLSSSSSPSSSPSSSYPYMYASGTEVNIYYATWLDLVSNGWAIAWIVLLAALAQGALSQASTHILNMTGIRIKTSLQGLIYRKTLLLNSTCIQHDNANVTNSNANIVTSSATKDPELIQETAGSNDENNSVNTTNCHKLKSNIQMDNHHHNNGDELGQKLDKETNDNSLNDIGAITNLMSEDTLNIMSFFWISHYVWAIPLKIGIVMYLLYLKLGVSAIIGSFVCILTMTPLQFLIGKAMSNNAEVMAKFTDNRLRKLHDCFVGIKLIKLNAWDNVFIKKITEARQQELKYLNKDSFYWTIMTILTHISTVLITFVTLAFYVYRETGSEFTASRLFSALALFQQLTVPLLIFPITVPIILSAVVSTKRLETFLSANEIQKQFEGIRNMARILSKSDASLDMYEVKDKSQSLPSNICLQNVNDHVKLTKLNEKPNLKINIPDKPAPLANSEPHTPLVMFDTRESLQFPLDHKKLSLHARKELLRNTPYVVIKPRKNNTSGPPQMPAVVQQHHHHTHKKTDSWHRDSLLLKMPDDVAVSVKDCKFSWNPQKLLQILYIRDIVIPRGKLTMIVGKNGSGKSSLLSALLMEMPLLSGDMIWNKTSTIAFVPQQPWLLNASIRENILFGESFRPKRYDYVLGACALKPDIELMPAGDLTVIGERGINLSGGQRQRVAIARALYSSANVVIMDDPLSSLDNEVARHIFEQSIKKMLLKANRTVILVTQQLNLVQQAHNLIVLKDGCLHASGSYKDIEVTHPHIIAKWNSIIAKANEKEQQNNSSENTALGRTARERWKLFKNVAKLGLQNSPSLAAGTVGAACSSSGVGGGGGGSGRRSDEVDAETEINTTSMENILAADDDEQYDMMVMPVRSSLLSNNTSFKLQRSPSTVYGSRHLIYDVPLPLDECQNDNVIMRRRRRTSSRSDSQQKVRPNSRTSSRLSNISNTPTELRRSLLTNSCGSTTSYMTNLSSNYGDETPATRSQSWQPFAGANKQQHQTVARNASSPPNFDERDVKEIEEDEDEKDSDAALVADLVKTSSSNSGFQQFLRRMSMRRSFKPKGSSGGKVHRNSGSILSISEESGIAGCSIASVPSIELSSVAATDVETETESWIAGIENEESIQDANVDYKTLLANNGNNSIKTGATATPATETPETAAEASPTTAATTETTTTTTTLTNRTTTSTSYDVERKYGKIPAEIYLLYLRASGLTIVLIFFITALIWQTLRVYTDAWLQQWTDDNINMNVQKATAALHYTTTTTATAASTSTATATPSTISENISAIHDEQQHEQLRPVNASTMSASASAAGVGVGNQQQAEHHEVTYYFHIYAVISCICIVMAMISTPAGQWAGCKARQNLHDKLLQSIMHKSLHFFQITPLGRIMNRFSNDMAIIDKKIAATSQRLLQFTLLCLCAILINIVITPWFLVVTIPVCLAYYVIQKFYRSSSRELQRIENATNSPVISHLSETIQGVTTIRAYNQESRFTEILFRRLEENTIAFTILNTSNRWLGISLDYLGGVIVFVAIVTALLAATIACNNFKRLQQQQQQMIPTNDGADDDDDSLMTMMTADTIQTLLSPLTPSPSLVGLAINYTLLMPIYLNWVVKLLADMEMYVGSVERIAYYAETTKQTAVPATPSAAAEEDEEKQTEEDVVKDIKTINREQDDDDDDEDSNGKLNINSETSPYDINDIIIAGKNNNNIDDILTKVPRECHDEQDVQRNDTTTSRNFTTKSTDSSSHNNDKLFNMTENNGSTDNNVDKTVATTSTATATVSSYNDGDAVVQVVDKLTNDNDGRHHIANDGHIAALTTKTFAHKQTTTRTSCDENKNENKKSNKTVASSNKKTAPSTNNTTTTTTFSPFSKSLGRNDAERRASVRHLAKNKKQYKPVAISWPQRGDISFENVSLRYEGQQEDVITNLNLTIPAGQRIGICGRTGSGKSSLALSLFGVLQTSHGCIRIDDNDIASIHPDEIRTRLSIIPQDVHLFSMTIRENLDPSGYYSDLELWNCLELAQLKEFVNTKMPQGLDTEIMDGGIYFSVGHRQLFCLARAILRGSVCLVLDEATSSLDSSTEKALLAAAHKAFQGRTIITIAHRLSTIMDYDRIIVLEKGKIVEDGCPQELKEKSGGTFATLLHSGRPLSTLSSEGL